MATASYYTRVLDLKDHFLQQSPKIVQVDCVRMLHEHRWWLREADRHATHGFYDGGEFPTLSLLGEVHYDDSEVSEVAQAERKLEDLLLKKRYLELYDAVQAASLQIPLFPSGKLGTSALLDGTYARIRDDFQGIAKTAGIDGRATFSTDVLLPRDIMQMNYPFSHLRILNLPPTPADLRVLFDWQMAFRDCFDPHYLISLRYSGGRNGKGIKGKDENGYRNHTGARSSINEWVMDLAHNHLMRSLTTINGSKGRIDYAVQQSNMHKKFWLYKTEKVAEHFGGKHPMLHDPREVYNAARRAIRRTHSYLQKVAKEYGVSYTTFPSAINP